MDTDRIPPFDEGAERGILGCVLLDPRECIPEVAARTENLFYDLRHKTIFDAAAELLDEGHPVDTITMQSKLKSLGKLEEIGGISYLSALPDATPSAGNLTYYIDIVLGHATRRRIIALATNAVARAYDIGTDPLKLVDEVEMELSEISKGLCGDGEIGVPALVDLAIESLEKSYHRGDELDGIQTGFRDLDKITNGLHAGEMIVIAARPSLGKTSLAMNIAEYVSTDLSLPVGVFSLEMTGESLIRRMVCSRAEVNERDVRNRNIGEAHFKSLTVAAGRVKRSNLHIDDTSGLSIMQLRARARRMHRKYGIGLLIIDYLQLLQVCIGRKEMNRQQEIANISNGIKALAKELSIPVIVLSQLNRELERDKNRKPRLSDLRESGAIEQDADLIGMLYCPDENPNNSEIMPVNMLIAKQRNGPTGDVNFMFFKGITRFKPRAQEG